MIKGDRIAFIRPRNWPLANVKVEEVLKKEFPKLPVDTIDLEDLIKKYPLIIIINAIQVVFFHGWEIIQRQKKIREAFWRTPYIFKKIKKLLANKLKDKNYLFTFQMQSIFDCSIQGVPHFIYTDHTHLANLKYPDFNEKRLYRQAWIDLEKTIYQNASLIFVRSTNILRSLTEQYNIKAEKISCVFSGSNVIVNEASTANKDYSKPNILFVGLDWQRKGGPELVEAFKLVQKKFPDARLTIAGASPQIQTPNINVVGKISPDLLGNFYKEASLFCLPTHVEPFGIVFLEAMQARLPIIGTNVGAVPDFIEDGLNGFLVNPGDVTGIADAIFKLLENPDLCRQFGDKNIILAKERYSWEAVGKKFHDHIIRTLHI